MEQVRRLVARIVPRVHFPGREVLVTAIFCYQQQFPGPESGGILVTKDLYPLVAKRLRKALGATEKALYRAADCCWGEGQNEALHQIIGRALPEKPRPGELLFYCAYYLETGRPYFW